MPEFMYTLYDGRYFLDEERASVYCIEDTLQEAKKSKRELFPDAVIVESKKEIIDGKEVFVDTGRTF